MDPPTAPPVAQPMPANTGDDSLTEFLDRVFESNQDNDLLRSSMRILEEIRQLTSQAITVESTKILKDKGNELEENLSIVTSIDDASAKVTNQTSERYHNHATFVRISTWIESMRAIIDKPVSIRQKVLTWPSVEYPLYSTEKLVLCISPYVFTPPEHVTSTDENISFDYRFRPDTSISWGGHKVTYLYSNFPVQIVTITNEGSDYEFPPKNETTNLGLLVETNVLVPIIIPLNVHWNQVNLHRAENFMLVIGLCNRNRKSSYFGSSARNIADIRCRYINEIADNVYGSILAKVPLC